MLTDKGVKEKIYMKYRLRKLKVIYKMKKKDVMAEAFIDLPISQNRYEELAKGIDGNKAWISVQQTLLQLTYLQDYDELGAWSIEMKIREN